MAEIKNGLSVNELKNLSLSKLIDLCVLHPKRKDIRGFICENFEEKLYLKYSKSIDNISKNIDKSIKIKIVAVRTCAKEIIDHIDFECISSFEDIEDIVHDQIRITKSFPVRSK